MGRAPRRVEEKARQLAHQAASRPAGPAAPGVADAAAGPRGRSARASQAREKVLARLRALHPMD